MKHQTPATIVLIAINALFFAATYLLPEQRVTMLDLFALHYPQSELFRIWQFVSYMFMHGSLGHIFLNMFGVYIFGGPLERLWGARRFLAFYFLAGIGAGLIQTGINVLEIGSTFSPFNPYQGSMVGASGALYGVLVGFATLFPNAKLALIFLPVPVAAKYFVPALLLLDLFSGVTGFSLFGGGIAHFAHIGGALIGFLIMLYWKKSLPHRPEKNVA